MLSSLKPKALRNSIRSTHPEILMSDSVFFMAV